MRYLKWLGAAMLGLFAGSAAMAATWQMATPYPASNFHTKNVMLFAQDIDAATGGKLKLDVHPDNSLIKHAEIKNAVRSRQVQIGEFFVSILANENPIFAIDSVPFVATSFPDAAALYRATQPVIEQVLGKQGLKVLYSVAWPPQGLYTVKPVSKVGDLQGMKFRVYNAQLARFAQLVGAVPAQVEVSDLAQAFTTGRVDAMLTSTSTGVDTKAWDYLKHFYDVKAYLPRNIVVVNQKVFDALPADEQKAVLDAAAAAQTRGLKMAQEDHLKQRNILAEHGIQVSDGSAELNTGLRQIGEQMAAEWGKSAGDTGKEVLANYKKYRAEQQ